jgi:hypothetical protein
MVDVEAKALATKQMAQLEKPTDPGRGGSDNRRFIEAVLWIVRTGSATSCAQTKPIIASPRTSLSPQP